MADCNDTLRDLFVFLDGELAPEQRTEVMRHLTDCPDCVNAFEFHAELKTVVAARCQGDELPSGLLERLQACFGDELTAGPPAQPTEPS